MSGKEIDTEYHFEGQRNDEDVIFVTRRHPWVLSKAGFIGIIIAAIVVGLVMYFGLSKITSIAIFAAIIFYFWYGFYKWYLFCNYLYILTNQRIIIIEQNNFWGRKIIEVELTRIQSLSIEVKGPIQSILNFGSIAVKTAGVDPEIVLKNIENPYKNQQKIIAALSKYSIKPSEA